jgi:hypothetical protein
MQNVAAVQAILVAVLMFAAQPAWSQCCLGAHNVMGESIDGRFRVHGDTLTRVGHHGPYHYKFSFLEKTTSGEYRELNAFEEKWEVQDHFNMEIMVSPTGNGFAVDFPHGCLTFYRRSGEQLFRLDSAHTLDPDIKRLNQTAEWLRDIGKRSRSYELDRDGYNVQIIKTIWFGNGGMHSQDSTLFLPLGTEATDLLDAQVIWFLHGSHQMLPHDENLIKQALARVTDESRAPTEEEIREFLQYGCSALPMLQEVMQGIKDEQVRLRLSKLLKDLEPWVGLSDESHLRDLELIGSMLFYPDSAIRELARWRIEQLVQRSTDKETNSQINEWIQKHRNQLKWNAAAGRYVSQN